MPAKKKQFSEATVREIRRRARRRFTAEEKIRIVLEGLRDRLIEHIHEDPPRVPTKKPRSGREREKRQRQRESEKKRLRRDPEE